MGISYWPGYTINNWCAPQRCTTLPAAAPRQPARSCTLRPSGWLPCQRRAALLPAGGLRTSCTTTHVCGPCRRPCSLLPFATAPGSWRCQSRSICLHSLLHSGLAWLCSPTPAALVCTAPHRSACFALAAAALPGLTPCIGNVEVNNATVNYNDYLVSQRPLN